MNNEVAVTKNDSNQMPVLQLREASKKFSPALCKCKSIVNSMNNEVAVTKNDSKQMPALRLKEASKKFSPASCK